MNVQIKTKKNQELGFEWNVLEHSNLEMKKKLQEKLYAFGKKDKK